MIQDSQDHTKCPDTSTSGPTVAEKHVEENVEETLTPKPQESPRSEKILSVGLPRTGSYSMTLALRHLGYRNVYHLLDIGTQRPEDWVFFADAADALFTTLPTFNNRGMTRQDWDQIFGDCQGIADIAGIFAESLIEAYPEAKVILVTRDWDSWWKSFSSLLGVIYGRYACFSRYVVEPIAGTGTTRHVQKVVKGWLGARGTHLDELRRKAEEKYKTHNAAIPDMVPPNRFLLYRLSEGWEPLCKFLGKDVPDIPFPHGNDIASLREAIWRRRLGYLWLAFSKGFWWLGLLIITRFLMTWIASKM